MGIPDHCGKCAECRVEYESRIDALTMDLGRLQRQVAELRKVIAELHSKEAKD
jgi:prefoldin subunit 5